jgi:hypothetical protein
MAKIRLKRKGLPTVSGSGTLYQGGAPSAPRVKVGQNFIGTGMLQRGGSGMNFSGAGALKTPQPHQIGQNVQTPAAPTATPAAAAPAATPPPQMPPVPVADSDYYSWLAQRQGEVNQQQIQYDAEDKNDLAARNEALRRMAQQRPEDLTQANRNYNRQGLFYSGALGKARGDIEADYVRQEGDTTAAYQRAHDAREAARQALLSGFSLEQAAQMAAAADRQAQRDADAASMGALAGPADATVAPATGQPGVPGGLVTHSGLGQNFGSPVVQALKSKSKKKHGRGGFHQYGL